ncbi:iron uptake system protein EfeO [Luteimonas huabeiensis]|uniref:iron uptake system protein EfeO n=1 Tax=Luteimonas huabeiensis TaxID=1244513 RepID=UPI000464DC25|nr:iron uptake system protein EfeO [Luteimonas huabeiensis]
MSVRRRLPTLGAVASLLLLSACARQPEAPAAQAADAAKPADAAAPPAYRAQLDAYRAWVLAQIEQLERDTVAFVEAVNSGELDAAARLYAPSRQAWERIEPVAGLYPALDRGIDARADDFKQAEASPEFGGWHRLEYAIFVQRDVDGLGPVAARLVADTRQLREEVAALRFDAETVVAGAAELIEEVAATKVGGEENRYAGTDLWDIHANLEGARRIVDLFRESLAAADPALLAQVDADFAHFDALLGRYREGEGWARYDRVGAADRNELKGASAALAESLSRLRGALRLG